ncbi:uncharacterized protein LOC121737447 [Aricia agestis]|uniref:uncharacterized protein LOC121737447 n=1 Tax=Aricia agestis TaxID=91739 RepID=UPI001C20A3CA|nr:uncharacterized protein LOC121737447 [Aricia agestis]
MKALLIFLFVSLTAGDKLNSAYLPPPGANYSGGAGDNEVPFEVPVGNFGVKDENVTRLTPGIFREGGVTSDRPSARYPERKTRPQEEAERNAVILNNVNIITPDGYFAYSFDTSNGIHADESGTASDGVKANGSYSYIGDDVPDAILKVIEQAAKDRDNGVFDDDGVTLPNSQGNGYYNENQKGTNVIKPNESTNQSPYEAARDYNDEYNQDSQKPGFPNNVRVPGRPTEYNTLTREKAKDFGANADRIKDYTNSPPSTERVRDFSTFTDQPKDYYSPSTTERFNGPDTYTDRPRYYYSPSTDGVTSTERIRPTGPFTRPSNYSNRPATTSIQQFGSYTNRPENNFYNPTSTGSVNEFGTYTNRPDDFNTGVVSEFDTATGRPSTYYGPSSTNTEFGTSAGRPKDVYSSSTQGTIDFDQASDRLSNNYNSLPTQRKDFVTDRPNDYYYSPTSTERRKEFDEATDRPGYYYGPSSTERVKPTGSFTRPGDYYTPTSTIGTNEIGTYTVRPTNYRYRPTSTERINEVNIITGKPSDYSGPGGSLNQPSVYYGPTSTKQTVTGRPIEYYGPSSTQRLKDFEAATGRPTDYYSPSSNDRMKAFDTATGRPIDYYSPSSTERIKAFDTASGRPIDYYSPSSTERIKAFDTATGRPNDYYGPSSTERIRDFSTSTGRPTDYYSPSSTDRIKAFDSATGRPIDYYSPSSTDRIKDFNTGTGRPIDDVGPSSTESIKDFARPNEYYGPSSTERIKDFGTATGRPTEYYGPSSTERITGEDFSGPKQPQRYDPETGYHY